MAFEGIAVMYMSMPMAAQALPVLGTCIVQEKKITLKFPLSSVSFDLPEAPYESATKDMEFKMAGPRGEMLLKINYKVDVRAFMGQGVQDGQNVLTFLFFRGDNPIKAIKAL